MLTITPREDLSLAAGRRVTVYRHAQTRSDPAHRAQYISLSQPAPDQTAHGPLTVSHDASARHSKKARALWKCRPTRREHPLTLVTPQAIPPHRGTRPPSQVKESTSRV